MTMSRVAVVTGAAQGIGREYARALAADGAAVVVADLNFAGAEEVTAAIEAEGGRATAVEVDVSDRRSTLALAKSALAAFGAVHILVNNAAIYHSMTFDRQLDVDIDYWRRMFSVNLDGALLCTQALAPSMIDAGWGRIVNQTSTAAYQGRGNHYACSKLALIGLTQGFAHELGGHGITVNAIAPGPTDTDATRATVPEQWTKKLIARAPIPRMGTTDDLVGALRFLVSDAASWVTGQTLFVDGGGTPRI
jgi:NAD(P)-dependent dehydrogenase (short-subunit alcohol dehydrogenase family)